MNEKQNIKQLPKDWKNVKLEEIVSILGDGLHGTPRYSETGEYFFINGNNLSDGKILIKENTKRVTISEYEKYKKPLNDKTILVSINGTLGNVAFYNNEKVILGKSACYFNVKEEVDKSYIRLLLTGQRFLNYAHNSSTGSTIQNVSLKSMREFNIPLPPKPTQQVIVSKIEELFSELDKGIENLHTAQQQLKTYRQSVLKWAFEGKLTETIKEWNFKSFKDSLKFSQGIQVDVNLQSLTQKVGYVRFLRIIDFTQGKDEHRYIENPGERYLINKDEVALVRYGATTGFVCSGKEGVIANNLFKVTPVDKILNRYLYYFLNSTLFQNVIAQNIKGAAMPAISFGLINDVTLPIPSIEEQHKIVQAIESRLSVADKMEESITQSLQQAEALRQSILKKAFEGRLV